MNRKTMYWQIRQLSKEIAMTHRVKASQFQAWSRIFLSPTKLFRQSSLRNSFQDNSSNWFALQIQDYRPSIPGYDNAQTLWIERRYRFIECCVCRGRVHYYHLQ